MPSHVFDTSFCGGAVCCFVGFDEDGDVNGTWTEWIGDDSTPDWLIAAVDTAWAEHGPDWGAKQLANAPGQDATDADCHEYHKKF